jgi:hypothetical protein
VLLGEQAANRVAKGIEAIRNRADACEDMDLTADERASRDSSDRGISGAIEALVVVEHHRRGGGLDLAPDKIKSETDVLAPRGVVFAESLEPASTDIGCEALDADIVKQCAEPEALDRARPWPRPVGVPRSDMHRASGPSTGS